MRGRFDQFAKQMTREGFAPAGRVETDAEVSPDARRIDVWFTPNPDLPGSTLAHLGLLGRIGRTACTIEPFHKTPEGAEVMTCVCKHHFFRCLLERRDPPPPLPVQWIISSGRPSTALIGLGFAPSKEWGTGTYEGQPLMHTRLVVVSELPATRDTLLVRLMGAGRVLQRAIHELKALPPDAAERLLAVPILLRLHFEVPADPAQRTEQDEEFFMSSQDIVEKFREEARQEGMVDALLTLYETRFGDPPAEIVATIRRTHDPTVLRGWLKLIGTRSAVDVAAAVRGPR